MVYLLTTETEYGMKMRGNESMREFNSGFTERSYYNIVKLFVEGIYGNSFGLDKFEFNFRDDNEVNAHAEYKNGYDFLSINTGTITEMFALVKTAFAQNDILCEFGNASNEKNSKYIGEHVFEDRKYQIRFKTSFPIMDPCREQLSTFVALMTIRFIVGHEIGHIVNGHTRLLDELYMNSKICMRFEKNNDVVQYCLDRRTLEMDADAATATYTMDHILRLYEQKERIKELHINSIEELFKLFGFSIACVFMRFELDAPIGYEAKSLYLPNNARYVMVIDAAKQTMLSYVRNNIIPYPVDEQIYDKAVGYGLMEAEKIFSKYGYKMLFIEKLCNDSKEFQRFKDEVDNNWENNIYSQLQKYTRTVLYSEEKTEQAVKDMKKKQDGPFGIKKLFKKI